MTTASSESERLHRKPEYTPGAPFDTNWVGPPELRPRIYRTQAEKDISYGVIVENEYRVPDRFEPTDVVIDIGAHIGSFSWLAYARGSRSVYAYEIDPWHVQGAVVNLGGCQDGTAIHPCAVVRGDEHRAAQYTYAGNWNSFSEIGQPVPSKSLDEIINEVCAPGEDVRFLKIDCEGGEWPILGTCTQLDRIQEIAGEWHVVDAAPAELKDLPLDIHPGALKMFLESKGFDCEIVHTGAENTGLFFAKRHLHPVLDGVTEGGNLVFTAPPAQEETELDVLREIRDMLKRRWCQ